MPPKRHIVKSGNAGNSTKATPKTESAPGDEEKKSLFPVGSKYPLSLLSERCQKNGWEKPNVDTKRQGNGNSFVVTLTRVNKDTHQTESVRMEPHPPYVMPSAIEARHWGATYALYRFCNSLQLNRVLPPGPREYWNQLALEHKDAPEHQSWMYESDPFAAKKAVEQRQALAAKKQAELDAVKSGSERQRPKEVKNEFSNAPEVRMAVALRESVEDAIKKTVAADPTLEDSALPTISEEDARAVLQQLVTIGFKLKQAQDALEFLSKPSSLAQALLKTSTPLEAAIEYLILHIPECDLPERMLSQNNSSNPFVVSAHSGTENIKKRWIEDRAVKSGYPPRAVRQCTEDKHLAESWERTLSALNHLLIGEPVPSTNTVIDGDDEVPEEALIAEDDLEALWAYFAEPGHLVLPINTADVQLHLMVSADHPHLMAAHAPPMYITSVSISAYVRLHLLSVVLRALRNAEIGESGIGFLVEAMGVLDAEWARLEESGPPDISEVLKYLLPPPEEAVVEENNDAGASKTNTKQRKRGQTHRGDDRSDAQVKKDFEALATNNKYNALLEKREKLPSFQARDEFLHMLDNSRVVVVVGETGCGKTTQLPQFILDSLILSGQGANASIIVTQPRRVAATSVAARVSAERLDDGSVGYAIRGESKQTRRTKLLFCTTGVVLRRLSSGDDLQGVTHVIVDEVHERSVDGDFLLLELKEMLVKHPHLKVVLMSATINHETFVKYFNNAPLLTIPGFTHPVTDLYLEDFMPKIKYRPSSMKSTKKESDERRKNNLDQLKAKGLDEDTARTVQMISRADRLDYQLIAAVVKHIIDTGSKRGGILVFLQGVQEIRQCIEAVQSVVGSAYADVFPLHANLSSDEQRRVFVSTSKWKIIAATNVAETSITIDDVIYVVDTGKVKETSYDSDSGLSRLSEQWITRAAGRQRRGRAGRTQPGTCYKLYTQSQEEHFSPFPIPEIMRVPLESIALSVKVAKTDEDVKDFLGRAVDPPAVAAMDKALSVLEELGAIDANGRVTALGKHISTLPVDLRLAKMLVLGTIFQCLDPVLTVAAGLSCKPLFVNPMDRREEANQARARLARGNSDLLTDAFAYDQCMKQRGQSQSSFKSFCEQNFISLSTVRDITSLRQDFLGSLSDIGFIPFDSKPTDDTVNVNGDNENLAKAVVLGALWPNVARVALPAGAIKFDKIHGGAIQRENTAKEFKVYELQGGQVFLHPASILFTNASWRSPFITYFGKHKTSKVFLRDATEIPIYALLLFGGPVTVNHVAGGLTISSKGGSAIKLKAWPRIGVLVNQLRRLLDVQLQKSIEDGSMLTIGRSNPVLRSMLALLEYDGLSS